MTGTDERVLLVHNVIAPYRLPVFEALSESVDLTVYFCEETESGRKWTPTTDGYPFRSTVLPAIRLGPIVLNYTILLHLLFNDYDVYVLNEDTPYFLTTLACTVAGRLTGTPCVIWTEHVDSHDSVYQFANHPLSDGLVLSAKMWFPNLYQRLLYPLVNHFVAFSPKAKRYLLRRGVDINQITTEIQSMPASLLGDLDVAPNEVEEEAETVIFTLAYLRPGKGIDTLISAYERIATNETHLVIAGDGPAEEQLRDMATGRTDITFTGFVSGEEKWSYYAAADVFVLPTRHDAWGLVINEAMYYGLPVVTTTAAGGSCVVNDEFVVPADDPDQLATTLAALRDDREYRDELGRRGAVREELFEPVTMSEAIRTAVEATAP